MEPEQGSKFSWVKNKDFFWIFLIYTSVIIACFVLSLKSLPLHNTIPKSGLIIGALFPVISLTYYYRHYSKGQGPESLRPSMLSWLLPALLAQVIIIFGFMILLGYPHPVPNQKPGNNKIHYGRSFFSGALHYGHLFNEFKKVQRDISTKKEFQKYNEISDLFNYYRPLLVTEETETCPPQQSREEYLAFCLQKFAKMSSAINAIPFYLAITFGFLGALIFSLSDLVIRFNMVDLYPKNFVFYSIRFVVATSLCATLANFFMEEFPVIMAIPVFFLIGYFPERAIEYLDQKMTQYLGFKTYEPLPLSLVQGMSGEKALRLRELGIEDVQHLAVADIQEMKKNLPFSLDMICDWVAQSLLILYFEKQIQDLRGVQVRTILDLQGCLLESPENEGCADAIESAKSVGISETQLRHVEKILATEPMRTRMNELRNCLAKECQLKPGKA